ncbi:MAG: alginate export family protein [Mariprofundaceae bacterium]|nr:alginate export family protein [Mariprofundaceae bacterium]
MKMFYKRALLLLALFLLPWVTINNLAYAANWDVKADLRERYQSFDNFNFDSGNNKNTWEIDSRLYLKAKADFGNGLTLFLQPQAVSIQNHAVVAGSQNFSQADLLQAYLQYNTGDFAIRLGRQQLVYGDQRLLGHLGWKDVARTFDGVKVMFKQDAWKFDVFAVHPSDIVNMTPKTATPQGSALITWEDRRLIGAYGTYSLNPKTGIDTYFINWSHTQQAAVGKGRNVNTYGLRGFGKWKGIDATAEAVFQSGDWNNTVKQSASAFALKTGYNFDTWKTRIGIEYDFSPGDAKTDPKTHKNFVFPFHTNHALYGEMDRFSWANMKDLSLSFKTKPINPLTLKANIHFLSLDKAQGDWLNVAGAGTLYPGLASYTQTKAGTEIDLKVVYKTPFMKNLKLVGLYGIFNPGAAVAERNPSGKADTARFGYLIANYVF